MISQKVGVIVQYTGEVDDITGFLMKKHLKSGHYYEVTEVASNNKYYKLRDTEGNYWYAVQCFVINYKDYLKRIFDLR